MEGRERSEESEWKRGEEGVSEVLCLLHWLK
jgi:hypothetical protein